MFSDSIAALQKLNSLGYGVNSDLQLNLVFNPDGINLPPEQSSLEIQYKSELYDHHGIVFNNLLTITNMPISRFGGMLLAKGLYEEYMSKLKDSFQQENLATVMCRNLLSIDYQGYAYDCDFNQMLDMDITFNDGSMGSIHDFDMAKFQNRIIKVDRHCFGCTAGSGSSCGGSTT